MRLEESVDLSGDTFFVNEKRIEHMKHGQTVGLAYYEKRD